LLFLWGTFQETVVGITGVDARCLARVRILAGGFTRDKDFGGLSCKIRKYYPQMTPITPILVRTVEIAPFLPRESV
jgi:hypothetical protein